MLALTFQPSAPSAPAGGSTQERASSNPAQAVEKPRKRAANGTGKYYAVRKARRDARKALAAGKARVILDDDVGPETDISRDTQKPALLPAPPSPPRPPPSPAEALLLASDAVVKQLHTAQAEVQAARAEVQAARANMAMLKQQRADAEAATALALEALPKCYTCYRPFDSNRREAFYDNCQHGGVCVACATKWSMQKGPTGGCGICRGIGYFRPILR